MRKFIFLTLVLGMVLGVGAQVFADNDKPNRPQEHKKERGFCKIILNEAGQKKVTCTGVSTNAQIPVKPLALPKKTKERLRNLVPSFKSLSPKKIRDNEEDDKYDDKYNDNNINDDTDKNEDHYADTEDDRNNFATSSTNISRKHRPDNLGRKIRLINHEKDEFRFEKRKRAIKEFKENLKENREALKDEFEQKREALKAEVKARGENGLAEIIQDPEKRALIQELQLKKLRIRLTESLEKIAHFENRLSDISERVEERIKVLEEKGIDISSSQNLLNKAMGLLETLDDKIEKATEAINETETINELKEVGKIHMTEIKGYLKSIKSKIREAIKSLKNLPTPPTNTDKS